MEHRISRCTQHRGVTQRRGRTSRPGFYFATSFVMDYTPKSRFARRLYSTGSAATIAIATAVAATLPHLSRRAGFWIKCYPRGAARLLLMRQITQRIPSHISSPFGSVSGFPRGSRFFPSCFAEWIYNASGKGKREKEEAEETIGSETKTSS